jgi:hypothetical protein
MVARVLSRGEGAPTPETEPLLILLRRFATESAREEARMMCDDLMDDRLDDCSVDQDFEAARFAVRVGDRGVNAFSIRSEARIPLPHGNTENPIPGSGPDRALILERDLAPGSLRDAQAGRD